MSTVARASPPLATDRLRSFAARAALPVALFAAAALISGFTMLRYLDPYDEGQLMLAVHRVAAGQWLYADFVYPYGPGHPLLLALAQNVFGHSLLWWRLVRVAADASVALLVFVIVRREAPVPVALLAWLAASTGLAQPGGPNPFPVALAFGLGAFAVATAQPPAAGPGAWRRPALAGVLVALAGFWRIDFGVYAGAGVLAALLLAPGARAGRCRPARTFVLFSLGGGLVLYLPFMLAAGPGALWHQMVAQGIHDSRYWTLPFPWSFPGPFRLSGLGHFAHDVKKLIDFYVPAGLLLGMVVLAGAILARRRRGEPLPWRWAGLLVFALGTAFYLRSRADEFHSQPLLVLVVAACAVTVAWTWRARRGPRWLRALGGAAGLALILLAVHGSWNRVSALLRPPALERVGLPGTSAITDTPVNVRALRQVVPFVQARVPPSEPIFVAPRRSDLDRVDDLLFYVLVGRDSVLPQGATLEALPAQQHATVAALEARRPRIVVRWVDPISSQAEPNLRGRPSGSRLLDQYLGQAYRRIAQFGVYVVLERR